MRRVLCPAIQGSEDFHDVMAKNLIYMEIER